MAALTDFYGNPVTHQTQQPVVYVTRGRTSRGLPVSRERSDLLPVEGWARGMSVISWTALTDPVCLHDRWGQIVYQWPENYMPTQTEVRQIIARIQ